MASGINFRNIATLLLYIYIDVSWSRIDFKYRIDVVFMEQSYIFIIFWIVYTEYWKVSVVINNVLLS